MGGYSNGRYPLSMMVKLGPEQYLPPGTAARWQWLVRTALEKYGILLVISPGWNGYRPYDEQVRAREELGIWAAVPGYSSHGLIYNGQQVAAIDVYNWGELGWARFKALCRLAGFTVDFVSPQELWHIGDFNDIWTVPEFTKEDDMPLSSEDVKRIGDWGAKQNWNGHKFKNGLTPGQVLVGLADSLARLEVITAGDATFFKHGGNVLLWIYVMPNGDFVRIRDLKTAQLYKERAGRQSVTLSTEAIRLLVADLAESGGRDLTATPNGEVATAVQDAKSDTTRSAVAD